MERKTFHITVENRQQVIDDCTTVINGYKVLRCINKYRNDGRTSKTVNILEQSELGATLRVDNFFKDVPTYDFISPCGATMTAESAEVAMRKMQVAIDTIKYLDQYDWNEAPIVVFP